MASIPRHYGDELMAREMGFPVAGLTGAWRSLVARLNGVQEVESSNLSAPSHLAGDGINIRSRVSAILHGGSAHNADWGADTSLRPESLPPDHRNIWMDA